MKKVQMHQCGMTRNRGTLSQFSHQLTSDSLWTFTDFCLVSEVDLAFWQPTFAVSRLWKQTCYPLRARFIQILVFWCENPLAFLTGWNWHCFSVSLTNYFKNLKFDITGMWIPFRVPPRYLNALFFLMWGKNVGFYEDDYINIYKISEVRTFCFATARS